MSSSVNVGIYNSLIMHSMARSLIVLFYNPHILCFINTYDFGMMLKKEECVLLAIWKSFSVELKRNEKRLVKQKRNQTSRSFSSLSSTVQCIDSPFTRFNSIIQRIDWFNIERKVEHCSTSFNVQCQCSIWLNRCLHGSISIFNALLQCIAFNGWTV